MIRIHETLIHSNIPITLGIIEAKVKVHESSSELKEALIKQEEALKASETIKHYEKPAIEGIKLLYRKFGKDPTRYRASSDSLFRRLVKNKGLYYVNNIVDLNNLISLKSYYPVGAYDQSHIAGDIYYALGTTDEIYEGIGRGVLNIENLPVLKDEIGPFGSSTSDSHRTMVTENTTQLMMVFYAIAYEDILNETLEETVRLLKQYAEGEEIKVSVIRSK
ncbi:MAG: hypothetical protein JXR88_15215 [Clostridia bacterium]|nr:hypothetical protein [Clostridia bacterium]